jgi:hypothetical protein
MRRRALIALFSTGVLVIAGAAAAFDISPRGLKWPGARTTIFIGIPGTSPSGIPWSVAYSDAATEWTQKTAFNFDINSGYRDPCSGTLPGGRSNRTDNQNGADFRNTVCGDNFPSTTIAITILFSELNVLGSADIVEADIIFNSNLNFDIYEGPQRFHSSGAAQYDFKRIALHELGHLLGLGHEDTKPAIMAPRIGSLFRLQTDDIEGVNTLYAGVANCDNSNIGFGWAFGRLEQGDCQVKELMVGGNDTSFVDVYKFELADSVLLTAEMKGDGFLDGALLLTDRGLRILRVDENSGGNCNPKISMSLQPGQYTLLANTYSTLPPPCASGNTGGYRLTLSYQSAGLLTLTGRQSFQGGTANAQYFGGVTTNGGQNYSNKVSPNQPFDVRGRIHTAPEHQGQPGYLVAAAITAEGETLVKNAVGDFVAYQPEVQLVPIFKRKTLEAIENIELLTQFVASSIGISSIEVDFYIGYGVDSNPTELYFHEQPINLIVE